jgi:hypothetical protein
MVAVTSCAAPRVGQKQTAKERMLSNRMVECFEIKNLASALMVPASSNVLPETLESLI